LTFLGLPSNLKGRIRSSATRTLKILATVAVLVPIGNLIDVAKTANKLETAFLNTDIEKPDLHNAQRIVRVVISRDEYVRCFHGQSPLDPDKLRKVIEAIVRQDPAVIVVDFDVSDPSFATVRTVAIASNWPVVWNRRAVSSVRCNQVWPERIFGDYGPVLPDQGLGVLPVDGDGLVRLYSRSVATNGPLNAGGACAPSRDEPTISWAALQKAENSRKSSERFLKSDLKPSDQPLVIKFEPPTDIPTSYVAHVTDLIGVCGTDTQPQVSADLKAEPPMKGKIVLVGGYYDTGDEHMTPVGSMFGVDIIAQVIRTELDGGGRMPVGGLEMAGTAFISAVMLWLAMGKLLDLPLAWGVTAGAIIVGSFATICSYLVSRSLALTGWFSFILCIVLFNNIWNHFQRKREKGKDTARPNTSAPEQL
jgi:CHASE2 domain